MNSTTDARCRHRDSRETPWTCWACRVHYEECEDCAADTTVHEDTCPDPRAR